MVSIIDDDEFFQYATKKVLESTEAVENILQFHDGEEAINYFLENKNEVEKIPDLVFLDLNMPYMDGWEFLNQFTANEFNKLITIYICSSSISKLDLDRVADYPKLKGYLIKPISNKDFYETLQKELNEN